MRLCAALTTIAGLAICNSLGAACNGSSEADSKQEGKRWDFSFSTYTYLAQHARDYDNPNFSADCDQLHFEARYNYEALKTGSVWIGYNFHEFCIAKVLKVNATPMLGAVVGDLTGVAPGYYIEANYKETFKASTQGEYFFDSGNQPGNFFYSWSEFSASLPKVDCFRAGLVVERTQASGNSDVRRGPLIGFTHKCKNKDVELTTYWLAPGSREATFVFAVEFK
jgi:hypothetical protein